jgi:two-component system phosphate regulon sensor histidine kinase PhoR
MIDRYFLEHTYRAIFWALVSLGLCSAVLTLFRTRPLSQILSRLEKMKINLAHSDQVELLYRKNEWDIINFMLDYVEREILTQKSQIQNQEIKENHIIASVSSPIVVIDNFQNITQSNESFKKQFESNNETKLWKVLRDVKLNEAVDKLVKKGIENNLIDFFHKESSRYFDIRLSSLKDLKGDTIGAVAVFYDVTHGKLTEKMRVDFVANVSHEIRTPLTSIKGYSQLLQAHANELPESLKLLTQKIDSNSDKLKDLFESLLRLSKVETNDKIDKESFSLQEMVLKIKSDIEAKHPKKVASFNFELKEDFIFGDKRLIEQVLANLIDNSFKYSQDNLIIDLSLSENESTSLIKLKDNGFGISSENKDRIFERFYRVKGDSHIEGSGLGLSIVKHIINKHEGKIEIESELQQGTQFTITLPKAK